jgi:flagellin-like protein
MNNKKGISAIVATVLIILITVAAVTIIWAAIIPMISNELGGATECFDASAALTVISDYSCFNETTGVVEVQVARATGDFTLVGLDISVGLAGSSETVKINATSVPDSNGAKVYTINTTGEKGNTYGNISLDGADSASVAAWVEAGQTEKLCDGSAVTEIRACTA